MQQTQSYWLLQASAGEAPAERRRRLKVEGILPTDPGQDGIAIGLDGQIYSDTAITAAVAQVGQLGPLNPKVAICHFPPQERAQFQVRGTLSSNFLFDRLAHVSAPQMLYPPSSSSAVGLLNLWYRMTSIAQSSITAVVFQLLLYVFAPEN